MRPPCSMIPMSQRWPFGASRRTISVDMNKLPLTCRTTCSIALLVAAFSSASAQDRRGAGLDKNHDVTHEHFDQHAAATLFKRKCQSCHTVPDTRHELDRAWLDQIKRTA